MRTHKLLIVALTATLALTPLALNAGLISVEIGDRPYFTHGPRYSERGYDYVWAPGHWVNHHRRWIHGQYVVAGRGHNNRAERRDGRPSWLRDHDDRNGEGHGYEDRHNSGGDRY